MLSARNMLRLATLAIMLSTSAALSQPQPQPCPDGQFRVDPVADPLFRRTCDAAARAARQVAECGLRTDRTIDIRLTDDLVGPDRHCLAAFDCNDDSISILRTGAIERNLPPGSPYLLLPEKTVFDALLVHEMTHAVLHFGRADRPLAAVDHEYIAAAMELGSLPPADRATLLDANPVAEPVADEAIDMLIYLMAPRRFAVAAWLHYRARGCAIVGSIVSGRFTFARTLN